VPAVQCGEIKKLGGGSWAYRYRDENGRRRQVGGFATKGAASAALSLALDRARLGPLYRRELTVTELVDEYLEQHAAGVDADTITKLRWQLRHATDAFGSVKIDRLAPREIAAWRSRLPRGSARDIHQALRQVLEHACRLRMLDENPAKAVPNAAPRRAEVSTFGSWAEVDAIADELGPWAPLVVFAAGTGLRPEEWAALEWRDVDRRERAVTVRRAFTRGRLKEWGKTDRSRRRVPLRQRAVDALEALPRRMDTRLVFPAPQGGHVDIHKWRSREAKAALAAAGLDYRPPYALRHFYAASSLAAGVSLYTLARRMGTSAKMIDATYGHLVSDAEAYERGLLDAYDARGGADLAAHER
jgi:integrase